MLFPTTIVGSYPQPEWLIDRKKLAGRFPPRVRVKELWRVPEEFLEEAWRDATLLAIQAQEAAGLDIVSDGEVRRESYSNRFATALDGVDMVNHGEALDRSGHPNPVPRVTGNIKRRHAVMVEDVKFLTANTKRHTKITVPGPFTMSQQAQIDHYGGSREAAAMDYAVAVNEEIRDLFAAGIDVVQIDGAERGAGWCGRQDGGAYLLWLCRHHPCASRQGRLFLPDGAVEVLLPADLHRNGAVESGLQRAGGVAREADHSRGD
jgi:5-methyltetrahydropteroyltriglutamate--homocysteine methyltransferase